MTVYGLSQTSGEERVLEVERADAGVLLRVSPGGDDGTDRGTILVPSADVVDRLGDPRAGSATIAGISPLYGTPKELDLEVRRNEVLLCVRSATDGGLDVAVGLDDLQDAVEAASG